MSRALLSELTALQEKGAVFETVGDKLRISAPLGLLAPELLAQITEHKAEVIKTVRLGTCLERVETAKSLSELYAILRDFTQYDWDLLDRVDVSDAYTPIAHRLIAVEQVDKFRTLENLAQLCWHPVQWTLDGKPASENEGRQIAKALGDCYGNGQSLRDDLLYQQGWRESAA